MNLLRLSIQQTYGQIGIQTHNASLDIQSPRGEQSIVQHPAELDFHAESGQLTIDSSNAWAALGKGPHMEWLNSIYSQVPNIFLQGLAKIVEDGNRMAQISNPENAFAAIARDWNQRLGSIEYASTPSYFNVKVQYTANAPQTNIEPVKADIQYTPKKPEVQYTPGSVESYMKQMNSIAIKVTEYDMYQ